MYHVTESVCLIPKPPLGKSTLLQHTINIKFKKKRDGKKERERRQQCYLRPGCPGMLSPSWSLSSLFPGRSGVELRKWGRCACKGAPSPGPLWMGPQSPDPGELPESSVKPKTPRSQSSRWAGGALTCHLISKPPWCGSQQQLPSLELPSPRTPAPSGAQSREVLGFWGSAGEGEKSQKTRALAHSTLIYSPGTQLSLELRLPKKLEGSMEDCRALVDVSCNNSLKTS